MNLMNRVIRSSHARLLGIKQRYSRIRRIASSPYRHLLLDEPLELKFMRHRPPLLHTISEDDKWQHLQIDDLAFFWPQGNKTSPLAWIYQEIFAPASWNPHTFEYGEVAIEKGDWVIDAGACEGFFTHYALKRGANVLVIEPIPVLAEALSRTFQAEIQAGRVQILWGAIGDKPGEFGLRISQDELYLSGLEADGDTVVPVYTLDGLLEQGVVPSIDFVKMDIEGHEVAAVIGATNVLRTSGPRLSIAVYHQEENARVIRQYLQEINPMYNVHWRGIWARDQDLPRPYMLYASQKR